MPSKSMAVVSAIAALADGHRFRSPRWRPTHTTHHSSASSPARRLKDRWRFESSTGMSWHGESAPGWHIKRKEKYSKQQVFLFEPGTPTL